MLLDLLASQKKFSSVLKLNFSVVSEFLCDSQVKINKSLLLQNYKQLNKKISKHYLIFYKNATIRKNTKLNEVLFIISKKFELK